MSAEVASGTGTVLPDTAPQPGVLAGLAISPSFWVGVAITGFWIAAAILWPLLAPYDPFKLDVLSPLAPPSLKHFFGTDELGRDVFSRVLAGATPAMSIAPVATLLSIATGTTMGLLAGYYRGWTDALLMRVFDAVLSFPLVITAILVLTTLGPSRVNVVLVIVILFTPIVARTIRVPVMAERDLEYVAAARLRGESAWYIMFAEILPNVTAVIAVEAAVRLGYATFAATTLSFLGLGAQRPSPDWGLSIALARTHIQVAPWTALFPAAALATFIVGVSLAADAIRRGIEE
ncbi:MAG TPA: ABC transporter permease [Bauldia sp.]|nr:ABC transporter permease [Bauldia sp.]